MKKNEHFVRVNQKATDKNLKIVKRMIIAFIIFLLFNLILLSPSVQKKINLKFLKDATSSGMLENSGIVIKEGEVIGPDLIFQQLKTCMVQIQCKEQKGCGVIWDITDTDLIIATCSHVIEEESNYGTVVFFNELTLEAPVLQRAENADLIFLHIPIEQFDNMAWADYTYVRLEDEEVLQAEDEFMLFGKGQELIRGNVLNPLLYMEDFKEQMIWGEAMAVPGMSGGGVFQTEGKFIGILCGGNSQKEIAILPADKIQEEYVKSGKSRS